MESPKEESSKSPKMVEMMLLIRTSQLEGPF